MQKKRTVRITAFFFIILVLLTFFSRTIYRHMLPNVQVTGVEGGILQYEHTSYDIRIKSQKSISIQLPILFTRPLSVNRIFVKPNQLVMPGDMLAEFNAEDGKYLIEEAEKKLDLAASTYTVWQMERERRMADLAATMKKTHKEANKALLEEDYVLLETGIMNGTTQTQLAADVALWKKTLASLRALENDQWRLRAQAGGFVEHIGVKEGDEYPGLDSILTLCPEGADYWIGCTWKNAPALRMNEWIIQGTIQKGVPFSAIDIEITENDTTVWFECPDDAPMPNQIASVEILADSSYNPMMVDNKALIGNVLYLLKSKIGAWRQTEYYIEEARVRIGLQDGSHTAILSGLNYNDVLVTSWDKPIQNGQTVLLTSYE